MEILTYDQCISGGMILYYDYKKTGVHMLGHSKYARPLYDWDFI
jgi:hypothetical protein